MWHVLQRECLTAASGTPIEGHTVTTRIHSIAYDVQSVTVFLVWHATVVEPACLRFSKTCHDGRVLTCLSNRGICVVCGRLKINTTRQTNVGLLQGQRRSRGSNIQPALAQRLVRCNNIQKIQKTLQHCSWKKLPSMTSPPNSLCRRPGHTDRHFMYTESCVKTPLTPPTENFLRNLVIVLR